jgi:hypothetical protein
MHSQSQHAFNTHTCLLTHCPLLPPHLCCCRYPIASAAADKLLINPNIMSVAVMLGGSAGWVLPYSYQCNLMVYAAGKYRTKDFVKIGTPYHVWLFVGVVLILGSGERWQVRRARRQQSQQAQHGFAALQLGVAPGMCARVHLAQAAWRVRRVTGSKASSWRGTILVTLHCGWCFYWIAAPPCSGCGSAVGISNHRLTKLPRLLLNRQHTCTASLAPKLPRTCTPCCPGLQIPVIASMVFTGLVILLPAAYEYLLNDSQKLAVDQRLHLLSASMRRKRSSTSGEEPMMQGAGKDVALGDVALSGSAGYGSVATPASLGHRRGSSGGGSA